MVGKQVVQGGKGEAQSDRHLIQEDRTRSARKVARLSDCECNSTTGEENGSDRMSPNVDRLIVPSDDGPCGVHVGSRVRPLLAEEAQANIDMSA